MAATASIKVEISSPYRGGTKVWSNRYHLTGPNWADQTHFNAYSDLLVADLKTVLTSASTIVATIGYQAGSDLPAFSKTYSTVGTFNRSTNWRAPLETVALVRFSTDQRSAKNHPIYLYKYWHDACLDQATTPDVLMVAQRSQMGTIASNLIAGYSDGTQTRKLAGPRGAVALGETVDAYVHHRDFPR